MKATKNMAATVKHKIGNAVAHGEEKKDDTKFAAGEKVDLIRAHGDEAAKDQATAKKNERKSGADEHREAEQAQNAERKGRAVNPHSGPIGNKPTPADLDRVMGADNPTNPANPEYSSESNATAKFAAGGSGSGATVPNYLGPSTGGQVA